MQQKLKNIRRFLRQYKKSNGSSIKMFNYPEKKGVNISDYWLHRFIQHKFKDDLKKKSITIFSVNGEREVVKWMPGDIKLFYTTENIHVNKSHWQKYEDLFLEDNSIHLSLGFDYIDHSDYLRFPYWIMAHFNPESDLKEIESTCKKLQSPKIKLDKRPNFCSLICKRDYFGDREFFIDQINSIKAVTCDGTFNNNSSALVQDFHNNKLEYLKNFKFNLCPENSNNLGYVTEKLFDAIYSGCIPIYWGSDNYPEPEILNQDAIIFIKPNSENRDSLGLIYELVNNPAYYKDFANQRRLKESSADLIYTKFCNLEEKLEKCLQL